MIRREWEGDLLIFGQPEHARLSGLVAEFWGSENFLRPEPWDDVLLATYEHDGGWTEWEEKPTLNPEGAPAHFTETPLKVNFEIFRCGARKVYDQGCPYAAALISRHASNVYAGILRGWVRPVTPDEQADLQGYVAEQEGYQAEICDEINERVGESNTVTLESVSRNGKFVTAMDTISLVLCNGWNHRNRLQNVPRGPSEEDGLSDIALDLVDPFHLRISPWPFSVDSIETTVRSRRLSQKEFKRDSDLHAALMDAPPHEMTFRLTPG